MLSVRSAVFCCSLVVAALAAPQEAFALRKINLSSDAGFSVVGQIWGGTYMCTQTATAKVYRYLGAAKLDDDVAIYGTNDNETIIVLTSSETFCGNTWAPPNLNGHYIDLHGEDGADRMVGGLDSFLYGGNGVDWLQGQSGGLVYGNNDPDCVIGTNTGDRLIAGNGDDLLCAATPSRSVRTMAGDYGKDASCGTATTVTGVEDEGLGCLGCLIACGVVAF